MLIMYVSEKTSSMKAHRWAVDFGHRHITSTIVHLWIQPEVFHPVMPKMTQISSTFSPSGTKKRKNSLLLNSTLPLLSSVADVPNDKWHWSGCKHLAKRKTNEIKMCNITRHTESYSISMNNNSGPCKHSCELMCGPLRCIVKMSFMHCCGNAVHLEYNVTLCMEIAKYLSFFRLMSLGKMRDVDQ